MCGICGAFETGRDFEPAIVKRMADSLRHRGPDADGFYHARGVALGHRRLSIIDVEGGHQPLSNEDGTVWIAFNGEIYNFGELNRRYLSKGHQFRTRSDTETIVHLYEELGEACFAELRGMFALALWDGRKNKLLLARDRIGKKPLFYTWNGKRLLFTSEIKSLWATGDVDDEINPQAVSDYFSFGYIPGPKTIFQHVHKLRPAHYLVVEGSQLREVCYWDLRFSESRHLTEPEWCERLMEEYRASVKMRLISDVPLGAFLSGGVDSSSVVSLMNEVQRPVTTCSIGFTEERYDEAGDARHFAESLGCRHFEHRVEADASAVVPSLAWHYDEPFADSSCIPTYYVSQVARQHVTVALSGDGGDESFAGYGRYRLTMWEQQIRSHIPAGLRRSVFGPLGEWYPKLGWAPRIFRAKSTFQSVARDLIDGYFHGVSYCPPAMKAQLLNGDLLTELAGYDSSDVLRQHYDRSDAAHPLSRIQYVDIKTYLTDDILTKVDRASMANSLEVRCPLLDHKLMELVAEMPADLKLRNGKGKYILKRALAEVLPASILSRRKSGFAVPVAEWFRGELKSFAHDILFAGSDDCLNRAFLARCWKQHQIRQRDWSALLWAALMFRTWRTVYKRQDMSKAA